MASADHRRCTECGRPVVIVGVGEDRGVRHVDDHDLCNRCWRDLQNHAHAARVRPKVDRATAIRERRSLERFNHRRKG